MVCGQAFRIMSVLILIRQLFPVFRIAHISMDTQMMSPSYIILISPLLKDPRVAATKWTQIKHQDLRPPVPGLLPGIPTRLQLFASFRLLLQVSRGIHLVHPLHLSKAAVLSIW